MPKMQKNEDDTNQIHTLPFRKDCYLLIMHKLAVRTLYNRASPEEGVLKKEPLSLFFFKDQHCFPTYCTLTLSLKAQLATVPTF